MKICAVILAAGSSTRLGFDKLTLNIDGEAVIRKAVSPFLTGEINKVYVVSGAENSHLEDALKGLPVELINNPNACEGMSSSVKAVLPSIRNTRVAIFHLGDKPFIHRETVSSLIRKYQESGAKIIVPVYRGKRGHPVLVEVGSYIREMESLRGDKGLREIIEKHDADVVCIEGGEENLLDIDTPQCIEKLRKKGFNIEEG